MYEKTCDKKECKIFNRQGLDLQQAIEQNTGVHLRGTMFHKRTNAKCALKRVFKELESLEETAQTYNKFKKKGDYSLLK